MKTTIRDEWLQEHFSGYKELPKKSKLVFLDFLFLWVFFEYRALNKCGKMSDIPEIAENWRKNTDVSEHWNYFRTRYFNGTEFTGHFKYLKLKNDTKETEKFKEILTEGNPSNLDMAKVLLTIIFRYRNNFFHGEKCEFPLKNQVQNFKHANKILMDVIESYSGAEAGQSDSRLERFPF